MISEILHEDEEILVCIKPAGIPTQTSRIGSPDMVSILKNHLRHVSYQKQGPYLAVIHRLDQPVEGLLVFAKTPAAAAALNRQLSTSGFGKHYLAVVHSIPSPAEGDLEHFLIKDTRTNTSRVCAPNTPGAKRARLHYRLLRTKDDFSITEITLDTGRHHQIRVQMSRIGCPIVGYRKYGSDSSLPLCIYAARITFRHPKTKEPLTYTYTPILPF